MQNNPDTPSPMTTAVKLAALMLTLSAVLMALLIYAALYVPENYRYHLVKSVSKLAEWLPPIDDLAPGMILINESKSTNELVSQNYKDPASMLAQLEEFGRQEGVSRKYAAPDRCREAGARFVRISLVRMVDAQGAGAYLGWLKALDAQQGKWIAPVNMGDASYVAVADETTYCVDQAPETAVELSFTRNNFLAFVTIVAKKDTNRGEDLIQTLALPIAELFDSRLR